MTREEFIKVLDRKGYSYRIEGDLIVVTVEGTVYLNSLTTLPAGVKFENGGDVWLDSLTTLPAGVKFENGGGVYLRDLTTLPAGVEFENVGHVYLGALTTLPAGVKFENGGDVSLNALVGGWFDEWKGNIKGINRNRLLNLMISKGLFER